MELGIMYVNYMTGTRMKIIKDIKECRWCRRNGMQKSNDCPIIQAPKRVHEDCMVIG